MICKVCADAADQKLPRECHCAAVPGESAPCDCQHRTERYGILLVTNEQ